MMVNLQSIIRKLPFESIGRALGYAGFAAVILGLFPDPRVTPGFISDHVLHWVAVTPLIAGMLWLYTRFALLFIEMMMCDPFVWAMAFSKTRRKRDLIPNYIREWKVLLCARRIDRKN